MVARPRGKGRESEFPFGLSRVLTTAIFVDAADADFRASALFAVCFSVFHDKWVVSIFVQTSGIYADQREGAVSSTKTQPCLP